MKRVISHTEGTTLLDCQAKWDFQYGGRLAGSALKKKETAVVLREGRAWGRAVAAFHTDSEDRVAAAQEALVEALNEDAAEQEKAGFYDAEVHRELEVKLRAILEHYVSLTEPMNLVGLERELLVPLPSRSGKGDSNRYFLQAFFDGMEESEHGDWLVEFKLRGTLSSVEQITNGRQIRKYAWAYFKETGRHLAGVKVDERLNGVPKPPKIVQTKKGVGLERAVEYEDKKTGEPKTKQVWYAPSIDKQQLTTPDLYVAACEEYGVEPEQETVDALALRRWQLREPVFLTLDELAEAGEELVSLGRQVADFDSGQNYPVRNPSKTRCPGCWFKDICPNPGDAELVDALFNRVPAKRDKPQLQQEVAPA